MLYDLNDPRNTERHLTESAGYPGSVLIAADDQNVRELLARVLSRAGYSIVLAWDGEQALALATTRQPDVVLLDQRLRGGDGSATCRHLKRHPRTSCIPVILSVHCDHESRIDALDAGADDFVLEPFHPEELKARVRCLMERKRRIEELDTSESVVVSLGLTVEARDEYTIGHCERLADYSLGLGRRIGLDREQIAALHRGAYLHDIGKIALPDAVLRKPGRLSAEEYAIVKQHPAAGARLCGNMRTLTMVKPIILHHHERLNGSGYPAGLRGDDIPLLAQVVSVVDVYDALTTDRPYRAGVSAEQALDTLHREAANGLFRTDLVREFTALHSATSASADRAWVPRISRLEAASAEHSLTFEGAGQIRKYPCCDSLLVAAVA